MNEVQENNSMNPASDDSGIIILAGRNAKKISPENRKKLLDMARKIFKEEFNHD